MFYLFYLAAKNYIQGGIPAGSNVVNANKRKMLSFQKTCNYFKTIRKWQPSSNISKTEG